MANRSYLYSLSNRPTSYDDRPDTISGLSEWAYAVPFSFRVLVSGDPQRCASLISDGFDDDPPEEKTALYAISGDFAAGFARLRKFAAAVRTLGTAELNTTLDQTEAFLDQHRDRFVLLETVEVDCMTEDSADGLRACVEREIEECGRVGAAIDALPDDPAAAGAILAKAAGAFEGLVFDDGFDNTRDDRTEYPLGLSYWTDVLYFSLWDKATFAANNA
jgi:hypothetical protein